ncbi:MAG: flagellar hook-length control protein FliK, partial [Burkholderiales bacterium]
TSMSDSMTSIAEPKGDAPQGGNPFQTLIDMLLAPAAPAPVAPNEVESIETQLSTQLPTDAATTPTGAQIPTFAPGVLGLIPDNALKATSPAAPALADAETTIVTTASDVASSGAIALTALRATAAVMPPTTPTLATPDNAVPPAALGTDAGRADVKTEIPRPLGTSLAAYPREIQSSVQAPAQDARAEVIQTHNGPSKAALPAVDPTALAQLLQPVLSEEARSNPAETFVATSPSTSTLANANAISTVQPLVRECEIKAHPASPVWRESLSAQVSVLIGERVQSAHMHLNPPELGPVEVRISIIDQQTSVMFTAPHEETRRALEDALPRLREVLAESGVNLDSTTVNKDHLANDARDPSHERTQNAGEHDDETVDENGEVLPRAAALPRRLEGLIDTFA